MEDTLGKDAPEPKPYTRLPVRLFHDYTPQGSLSTILLTCYRFRAQNELRRLDLRNSGNRERNLQLYEQVLQVLIDGSKLKFPVVFFGSSIPASELSSLTEIVKKHGGTVASNQESATHIVENGSDEASKEDDDEDYIRVVERRDKFVLVHWWYYPDSYDSWLASSEVEGEPGEPPAPSSNGKWIVVRASSILSNQTVLTGVYLLTCFT